MYIEKAATALDIVEHYREVNALLTDVGYSMRRRGFLVGKTVQTLKQYAVNPDSAQHRRIPSADLDKLRVAAIDEFWRKQWDFLSDWSHREGVEGPRALPLKFEVANVDSVLATGERHFFHPRVQEIADETGGVVYAPWYRASIVPAIMAPKLTPGAAKRSRWRKAIFALRKKAALDEVKPILSDITGYCEYSVLRIGIEYFPWRIAPQDEWIAKLEERTAS
jgi:hypothetical protein